MKTELILFFNWLNTPAVIAEFKPLCISRAANLPLWCNAWEDIWQETMKKLWCELSANSHDGCLPERLRDPKHLKSYIITTIRNAATDLYRKRKPIGQLGEIASSLPAPEKPTIYRSDIETAQRILQIVLKKINGRSSRLFLKACTEPKTFKELARKENVNPKTIIRAFKERNRRPVVKAIKEEAEEVLGPDCMSEFLEIVTNVINPGKKVNRLIRLIKRFRERDEQTNNEA